MNGFPLAFILVGTLIVQVFIPGFPKEGLLLLAGINYGVFWGTIINWVGMIAAAQVGYEVVLHSVKVGGRFSDLLEKYENSTTITKLQERGNFGLFLIRLIPYAPNDVLSLLSGALFLPRKGFILVSIITALPYAFVFAYLGAIGSEFVDPQSVWFVNLGLFILTLMAVCINYFYQKIRITSN